MTKACTLQLLFLMISSWASFAALPESGWDPELLKAIQAVKAIDHHAHPPKVLTRDENEDPDVDALTLDGLEPFAYPLPTRPDNPVVIDAWRALYGYEYPDMATNHVQQLIATKQRFIRERGDNYPAWVLDQLGIQTMFANRVAIGRGLNPARFRWVSFCDAFLFPLNNAAAKRMNPDRAHFYTDEERLLKRYLAALGKSAIPETMDSYLKEIVTPTLERQRRDGAVAIKFEAAYLRPLDFSNPESNLVATIYRRYVGGGEPEAQEYKQVQDYFFHVMAQEAGRLALAVHFHCAGGGVGSYFNESGGNPMLLEPTFNDPSLRQTKFVLVHGGHPWAKEVAMLFAKPNVYADFSAQTFLLYPRALSQVLRVWLEAYPEKVLFGTDTGPGAPELSWEEQGWMATQTAREALAIALTGMMNDHEITREQALDFARMVLHDNAAKLYSLQGE